MAGLLRGAFGGFRSIGRALGFTLRTETLLYGFLLRLKNRSNCNSDKPLHNIYTVPLVPPFWARGLSARHRFIGPSPRDFACSLRVCFKKVMHHIHVHGVCLQPDVCKCIYKFPVGVRSSCPIPVFERANYSCCFKNAYVGRNPPQKNGWLWHIWGARVLTLKIRIQALHDDLISITIGIISIPWRVIT